MTEPLAIAGRILNRFSKDMSIIDQVLPKFYLESILTGLLILGIISIESITNYWLMIVVAALVVVILALRRMTVNTISLLKRFEGICELKEHPRISNDVSSTQIH